MKLSEQDRAIVESTVANLTPTEATNVRVIHEQHLVALRSKARASARAIAMRELALELLDEIEAAR